MNWIRLFTISIVILFVVISIDCKAPSTIEEMVRLSKSKDLEDRREALEYSRQMKDKSAVPSLLSLLKNQNDWTRICAIKGLSAIGDRSTLQSLWPFLSSKNSTISLAVAIAIGKMGDKRVLPYFFKEGSQKPGELHREGESDPMELDDNAGEIYDHSDEKSLWLEAITLEEIYSTLNLVTGRDYGEDYFAWLRWYETEWKPEHGGGKK